MAFPRVLALNWRFLAHRHVEENDLSERRPLRENKLELLNRIERTWYLFWQADPSEVYTNPLLRNNSNRCSLDHPYKWEWHSVFWPLNWLRKMEMQGDLSKLPIGWMGKCNCFWNDNKTEMKAFSWLIVLSMGIAWPMWQAYGFPLEYPIANLMVRCSNQDFPLNSQ